MKLPLLLLVMTVIVTVSPAKAGLLDWFSSSPKGLYQNEDANNEDKTKSLNFFSDSSVDITTSEGTFSGHYELKGNGLRVTVTVLGTEQAFYFTRIKQGFISSDGAILRSPEFYKRHAEALAKYNQAGNDESVNPDLAMKEFSEAIAIDPDYDNAYCERGKMESGTTGSLTKLDYDAAIQDFDKAISTNPQNFSAYYFRSKAKEKKGDLDGAISDMKAYMKITPFVSDGDQNELGSLQEEKENPGKTQNP